MSNLIVNRIETSEWQGVRLATKEGSLVRTIAVAVDVDGRVTAARAFEDISDTELMRNNALDSSQTAPAWVFPLLEGRLTPEATKALNINASSITPDIQAEFENVHSKQLRNVDKEAVSLLASSAEPKLHLLEFYSGSDERAENRKRHGALYPIFSDILAARLQTKRVIDMKSGSLGDALSKVISTPDFSFTAPYLKRFATFKTFPADCSRSAVLELAAHIPSDWIPKQEDEWVAFCQIATAIIEDLRPPVETLPAMLKQIGGKWVETQTKIMAAAYPPSEAVVEEGVAALPAPDGYEHYANLPAVAVEDRHPTPFTGIRASMTGVRNMISSFCDNVMLPLTAFAQPSERVFLNNELSASAERASFNILLANRSLWDIAEFGRRFHQEQYVIMEGDEQLQAERKRFIAQQVDGDWPGLTSRRQAPNGLWIVPETSLKSLRRVSAELDHCVGRGNYDVAAERCDCHIVSIKAQDEEGKLRCLSTIEFKGITGPNGPYEVRQHRAYKNGDPSEDAEVAARWYIDSMKAGQIETNWEQIKIFKDVDLRNIDAVERNCRYDWRVPEYVFAAVVPWHPFFVRAYKAMTFEQLVESEQVAKVSADIVPDLMRMSR